MSNLLVNTRDQEFMLFEQLQIDKLFETKHSRILPKNEFIDGSQKRKNWRLISCAYPGRRG